MSGPRTEPVRDAAFYGSRHPTGPTQTLNAIKEIDFSTRDITAKDLTNYTATARFYLDIGKVTSQPDVAQARRAAGSPRQTKGS
ncbi:hypothetical protein ABZ027_25555 [Streptomyces sp. NPDC006332]|uniref:hypothetical protein n=1 Tax=Streptomyces sp. NPDC006332 TaxID=3155456 RepID=UPI0033A39486